MELEAVLEIVRRTAGGFVDADAPLMEAGVDSLGAVELRNQLQGAAGEGVALPSTLVFDHPTARGLTMFLGAEAPRASSSDVSRSRDDATGVISRLACVSVALPGGARGRSSAWQLVASGCDTFEPSPSSRWDSDQQRVRYGAFLHGADLFDNVAFGISTPETSTMDPQQRLLLELGYVALHEGKVGRADLMTSDMAVFVGVMSTEYREVVPHANAYTMTGTGHCFAAGRLSYVLGLHGVCEALDVACSSALVACHNAHRALQMRECCDALVAGVNMMFLPSTLDGFAAAGLTSPSGKAFVFDARANGFIRAEGCGAGVLQEAATEGAAAIAGSSVRQDGRSASLTAPNGRAQQRLLNAVLADACTTSSELQLVEAAANGSSLGDPIEASAIAANALE